VILTLLAVRFLWIVACDAPGSAIPDEIAQTVEQTRKEFVPDKRHDRFEVEIRKHRGGYIVKGEVINPEAERVLFTALKDAQPKAEFIDSLVVLPEDALAETPYGIVRVAVVPMRRTASVTAEQVSQTVLGTVVPLYKKERGSYLIQNWDRYLGWVKGARILAVDADQAEAWQEGPRVVCTANHGPIHARPVSSSDVLHVMVPGCVVKRLDRQGGWIMVEIPDGEIGYVRREHVEDEEALQKVQLDRSELARASRRFLGVPYLWGGTSPNGFDCSGFVQTVYRMNAIQLSRDASQQVLEGEAVDFSSGFDDLLPADLLFFEERPGRITHVALYLGEGRYIQSSSSVGCVNIRSLNREDPLFNEYLLSILKEVRRILN
jgi:hypothetical protein